VKQVQSEPLSLAAASIGGSGGSAAQYLDADRGLSLGHRSGHGLKDLLEICVECDAGSGMNLKKSLSGMFGRWQTGRGYSYSGGWRGRSSVETVRSSELAAPVITSLAANGGLAASADATQDGEVIATQLSKWEHGGFEAFPGEGNHFGILKNDALGTDAPPVPEPATLVLVAGGLAAAEALRRRRRQRRT
jgi:hypothetical protein